MSECVWHFLSWVWLKERCSNPFTEPHPIDSQLLVAASAIAESFHMWTMGTAQDCQLNGWAQGPGFATGNWMALDKIFNYLCSLCLICKVICTFVLKFWHIYRQLVLETQFINRICMIYHFLKRQYFSDAIQWNPLCFLAEWVGREGKRQKVWLKYWKWELVVWDNYIDFRKFPPSSATEEPTLLPFLWPTF